MPYPLPHLSGLILDRPRNTPHVANAPTFIKSLPCNVVSVSVLAMPLCPLVINPISSGVAPSHSLTQNAQPFPVLACQMAFLEHTAQDQALRPTTSVPNIPSISYCAFSPQIVFCNVKSKTRQMGQEKIS